MLGEQLFDSLAVRKIRRGNEIGKEIKEFSAVAGQSFSLERKSRTALIWICLGYVKGKRSVDAARITLRMLEVDGILGVDLSGGAGPGQELAFAEALAQISSRTKA